MKNNTKRKIGIIQGVHPGCIQGSYPGCIQDLPWIIKRRTVQKSRVTTRDFVNLPWMQILPWMIIEFLHRYGNMNQAVVSTGALPPSTTTQITTPTTNDSKFEYIDALPDNTVHQFKAILVHYIRKRLPKGYRQLGKQTVSIPATE
ncbi:hypothetical protein RhiirC2_718505, partial [Rhizophagus irregularis]